MLSISRYKPFCSLVRTLSGFIHVSLYVKRCCFYISLMFMGLAVRYMLGDPNGNCFVQCIAAHPQLWSTIMHRDGELVSQPRQMEPGPTARPQGPASACYQAIHIEARGCITSTWQQPLAGSCPVRGVWTCGIQGFAIWEMLLWSVSVVPPPHPPAHPRSPFCSCPSGLLVSLDTFLGTCPCFACASFLGRMTSLPEREHSCEIQGGWAQSCIISS